jgi:tRNA-specific adenosine deaminase 3
MNLVRDVASVSTSAEASGEGRNGQHYLLTSRTLFTSHEPCIMCSMALVHSRVKDVFYIYPMSKTGGCGGSTCVPGLKGVNHRFGIWRWKDPSSLGDQLHVDDKIDA